jgi:hypothetical protein
MGLASAAPVSIACMFSTEKENERQPRQVRHTTGIRNGQQRDIGVTGVTRERERERERMNERKSESERER